MDNLSPVNACIIAALASSMILIAKTRNWTVTLLTGGDEQHSHDDAEPAGQRLRHLLARHEQAELHAVRLPALSAQARDITVTARAPAHRTDGFHPVSCAIRISVLRYCVCSVTHSSDRKSLEGLFEYLEDDTIIKDKAGMWKCIEAVAKKAFDLFIAVKKDQVL